MKIFSSFKILSIFYILVYNTYNSGSRYHFVATEEVIYNEFNKLIMGKSEYAKIAKAVNPYGKGNYCKRITDILGEKSIKSGRINLPKVVQRGEIGEEAKEEWRNYNEQTYL